MVPTSGHPVVDQRGQRVQRACPLWAHSGHSRIRLSPKENPGTLPGVLFGLIDQATLDQLGQVVRPVQAPRVKFAFSFAVKSLRNDHVSRGCHKILTLRK